MIDDIVFLWARSDENAVLGILKIGIFREKLFAGGDIFEWVQIVILLPEKVDYILSALTINILIIPKNVVIWRCVSFPKWTSRGKGIVIEILATAIRVVFVKSFRNFFVFYWFLMLFWCTCGLMAHFFIIFNWQKMWKFLDKYIFGIRYIFGQNLRN